MGILLNHMRLWPELLRTEVVALNADWQKLGKSDDRNINGCWMDVKNQPLHDKVWGGRKRQRFMEIADHFANWFFHNDPEVQSEIVQKKAAFILTLRGFTTMAELADVEIEEVAHMTTDPVVKSSVRRAIELQTARAAALRSKRKSELFELARKKHAGDQICVDGNIIAAEMFSAGAPDALERADEKLSEMGVTSTAQRPRPRTLIQQFEKAAQNQNKENLIANMNKKMSAVQAHCWAGSKASVRSGLRSFCLSA